MYREVPGRLDKTIKNRYACFSKFMSQPKFPGQCSDSLDALTKTVKGQNPCTVGRYAVLLHKLFPHK